jgi:uncharacterized Zn finger protein
MPEETIFCPTCGEDTEHALVKAGQENLVRCAECSTIHPVQAIRERLANIRTVMNRGETSVSCCINLPEGDLLKVGQDLLVDAEAEGVMVTEITSLESKGRRLQQAQAKDVETIWARAVDRVELKISIYRGGRTRSLKIPVPGSDAFAVGEVIEASGIKFKIVKIKLRGEGFVGRAEAKDIVRLWGRGL